MLSEDAMLSILSTQDLCGEEPTREGIDSRQNTHISRTRKRAKNRKNFTAHFSEIGFVAFGKGIRCC
jgi:hypothetical protein